MPHEAPNIPLREPRIGTVTRSDPRYPIRFKVIAACSASPELHAEFSDLYREFGLDTAFGLMYEALT